MKKSENNAKNTIRLVFILRIVSAVYILFDPFWGVVATLLVDWLDSLAIMNYGKISYTHYENLDKRIDLLVYTIMLAASYNTSYFSIMLILYIYRMIGNIIFVFTNKSVFLFLFPNILEPAFIVFVSLESIGYTISPSTFVWFIIVTFQLVREYVLHVYWPNKIRNGGYPKIFNSLGFQHRKI